MAITEGKSIMPDLVNDSPKTADIDYKEGMCYKLAIK